MDGSRRRAVICALAGMALWALVVASGAGASVGGAADGDAPDRDVFKVLVQPPPVVVPPEPPKDGDIVTPPPVPKLRLTVAAIAGEGGRYVAVVRYGAAEHIVEKGWESEDKQVRVVDVRPDSVEVYYAPTQGRQVFPF